MCIIKIVIVIVTCSQTLNQTHFYIIDKLASIFGSLSINLHKFVFGVKERLEHF